MINKLYLYTSVNKHYVGSKHIENQSIKQIKNDIGITPYVCCEKCGTTSVDESAEWRVIGGTYGEINQLLFLTIY